MTLGRGLALLTIAALGARADRRIRASDFTTPQPAPAGAFIVVGFLGAWETWDNPKRSVRKLALRLREQQAPNVFVETAGHRSRRTVRAFLKRALDRDLNGRIDAGECDQVGIALYGQSWGGAAAVKLARELNRWGVPVRLTVQVDSVGRNDELIPPNVARAVNLYQRDPGSIWGENNVRAQDASRTQILMNQRLSYLLRFDIDMSDYPLLARKAPISHWKMDNDPLVWGMVEAAILAEIAAWQFSR